jgi:hypothetical protein
LRPTAALLMAAAYGLLAHSLSGLLPWYAPLAAALSGAVWVLLHFSRLRARFDGAFLTLAAAGAGTVAVQGKVAAALAVATCALVAWDIATMRQVMQPLPLKAGAQIRARYTLQAVAVGVLCLALAFLGLVLRPQLAFPSALGLSLVALVLLGLALWYGARVAVFSHPPDADADGSATDEDAGGR